MEKFNWIVQIPQKQETFLSENKKTITSRVEIEFEIGKNYLRPF